MILNDYNNILLMSREKFDCEKNLLSEILELFAQDFQPSNYSFSLLGAGSFLERSQRGF